MGWTAPKTWVASEVLSAANLNTQVRDNLSYLLSGRVFATMTYYNATPVTTTSTTFVDTDATNHKITFTPKSTRALVCAMFRGSIAAVSDTAFFDLFDGTQRLGDATYGLHGTQNSAASSGAPLTLFGIVSGLTPDALATVKIQFCTTSGSYAAAIIAAPLVMWALEV